MTNSTSRAKLRKPTAKPAKPYDGFPLFAHATKRWAKKIRGKLHYFGPWDDPQGALDKYLEQKDDLYAGRKPRTPSEGLMLRHLLNRFLTAKQSLVDTGEIVVRTFRDYHATCKTIGEAFGFTRVVEDLGSDDFEQLRRRLAKSRGPVALGNEIQRVRGLDLEPAAAAASRLVKRIGGLGHDALLAAPDRAFERSNQNDESGSSARERSTSSLRPKRRMVTWKGWGRPSSRRARTSPSRMSSRAGSSRTSWISSQMTEF